MSSAVKPYSSRQEKFGNSVIKFMSSLQVWLYQKTNGKVAGKFLQGAPVALLTTRGRRSGEQRVTPLLFLEDGENVIIVASKGGFSKHPSWYYNLQANPETQIQILGNIRDMLAREATAEEIEVYWPKLNEMYSDFEEYKQRAAGSNRNIPIFILTPTEKKEGC